MTGRAHRSAWHAARSLVFAAALVAALVFVVACGSTARTRDAQPTAEPAPVDAVPSAPVVEPHATTAARESAATPEPTIAPAAEAADAQPAARGSTPTWIEIAPRVRVDRASRTVEFEALAVLDTGFLEQFVCTEGTREHESLFVFEGRASSVHAALLAAGFASGSPGRWIEVEEAPADAKAPVEHTRFKSEPPTGSALRLSVRLPNGDERPLEWFIRLAPIGEGVARDARARWDFVFAGSRFRVDRRTGAERYLADGSGSLVGLVTFGDETIAPREVIPDQAEVESPMWEVWTERMPPLGTRVTVVVRPGG
jgi:hypothetical protein